MPAKAQPYIFGAVRRGTSRFWGPSETTIRASKVIVSHKPPQQEPRNNSVSAHWHSHRRWYFTDADRVRNDDPYAVLGLSYGDGCTLTEIKQAFRAKAKQLHPDVQNNSENEESNSKDNRKGSRKNTSIKEAHKEFQRVLKAYETLTKIHNQLPGLDASKDDEWRTSIYRRGDRIAVERTDVAGVKRVRPVPSPNHRDGIQRTYVLGHPQRGGIVSTSRRGEYLEQPDSTSATKKIHSSSVGRGQNKWVTRRTVYTPWNKEKHAIIDGRTTSNPDTLEQARNEP